MIKASNKALYKLHDYIRLYVYSRMQIVTVYAP